MAAAIEDVHIHWVPAWWYTDVEGAAEPPHPQVSDLDFIVAGARDGAGSRRVLSASVEILYGTRAPSIDALRRVNAAIAAAVASNPDALLGLATIDAFAGSDAGDEVRYTIEELRLSGIIVDSVAPDGAVIGDEATLPSLRAAAELGVPVFVHPVWTPDVADVQAQSGRSSAAWGRGYQSGRALLHLLHTRVVTEIPELCVVFTSLGVGAFWFAHEQLAELGPDAQIYLDTTGLHPPSISYAIDVLGPERILVGTDFPFHDDDRAAVLDALDRAGLSGDQRELVLNGNFRSLFTRNVPVAA